MWNASTFENEQPATRCKRRRIVREAVAQAERHREFPLPDRDARKHTNHEMRRCIRHPSAAGHRVRLLERPRRSVVSVTPFRLQAMPPRPRRPR
jgi:hypothetical protein